MHAVPCAPPPDLALKTNKKNGINYEKLKAVRTTHGSKHCGGNFIQYREDLKT